MTATVQYSDHALMRYRERIRGGPGLAAEFATAKRASKRHWRIICKSTTTGSELQLDGRGFFRVRFMVSERETVLVVAQYADGGYKVLTCWPLYREWKVAA